MVDKLRRYPCLEQSILTPQFVRGGDEKKQRRVKDKMRPRIIVCLTQDITMSRVEPGIEPKFSNTKANSQQIFTKYLVYARQHPSP